MHGYPIIQILPFGQFNGGPQVNAGVQAGLRLFVQTVPYRAFGEPFFRSERLKQTVLLRRCETEAKAAKLAAISVVQRTFVTFSFWKNSRNPFKAITSINILL